MTKKEIMIIADYSHETSLTLQEVCEACAISNELLNDFIRYDIIHPKGLSQAEWRINLSELRRLKAALRIQHDLEVNVAGVALVLDLLDQLKELESKMSLFERHYL